MFFNLYFLLVAVPTDSDLPDVTFEGTADTPSMYLVILLFTFRHFHNKSKQEVKIHSLPSIP